MDIDLLVNGRLSVGQVVKLQEAFGVGSDLEVLRISIVPSLLLFCSATMEAE